MVGKYKVITLCGSTRFKEAFLEVQKRLTLEGNIVISVGLFGHSGDDEVWTEGTKEMLDDMHKRKIDMADEIYVINVGGYIGSSTRSEIEYAKATGKGIRYLEEDKHCYIPDIDLETAIKNLRCREKAISDYVEIMRLSNNPQDLVFQKKYDAFYRVRRNEAWRSEYFKLMNECQGKSVIMFRGILLHLYQVTGQIEPSFTSKMLATIDPDMPIWDSNVLKALGLKPKGSKPDIRLTNAIALYDLICQWYKSFLQREEAKIWIQWFDDEFPEYKKINVVKKIDYILWASQF